jgi:histidinol dehydrogenase
MRVVRNIESLEKALLKKRNRKGNIVEKVAKIVKDVETRGDDALLEYTKKFDKVKLQAKELRVSESEISAAFNELDSSIM